MLTGLQSDDLGNGQTGVILAELLGLPHATIIMNVAVAGGRVKVKRELEDGWFQQVEMPLPAVLTIQSGSYKLRYATLIGIKKARTKEVKQVSAAELGAGAAGPRVELARLYAPQKARQTADARRRCRGCGRAAGGKAETRGAGAMSGVLAILEQNRGNWHSMSWETLAAAQQLASALGQPLYAAVAGSGIGSLAGELAATEWTASGWWKTTRWRVHRRRLHGGDRSSSCGASSHRWCCSRTPTRCATSRRSWPRDSAKC